jgi:glucosyl-dolichyl phosphate glucuronosyltransferase
VVLRIEQIKMRVTAAICTWNRAESLRRTLDSLATMRVPTNLDWDLLIINNNCTDHTDAVIREFCGRLPIQRLLESKQGQSHARNRAIDAAQGDYVIWTDDDVVVDLDWLAAYVHAFLQYPDAAVFGGPISPRYEAPVVKWIKEGQAMLGGPYAIRDFGDEYLPLSIQERRVPYGANFAVRAAEQRMFRYDPNLGLGPGRRGAGEEVDMIERLLRTGATGYWVPTARVEHCIGHNRQTVQYIRRHFVGAGETDAFLQQHTGLRYFGVPRWMFRQLVEQWFLYRLHRLISSPAVWLTFAGLRLYVGSHLLLFGGH